MYDYANRLTALGVKGATTTYGYDAFGKMVSIFPARQSAIRFWIQGDQSSSR